MAVRATWYAHAAMAFAMLSAMVSAASPASSVPGSLLTALVPLSTVIFAFIAGFLYAPDRAADPEASV